MPEWLDAAEVAALGARIQRAFPGMKDADELLSELEDMCEHVCRCDYSLPQDAFLESALEPIRLAPADFAYIYGMQQGPFTLPFVLVGEYSADALSRRGVAALHDADADKWRALHKASGGNLCAQLVIMERVDHEMCDVDHDYDPVTCKWTWELDEDTYLDPLDGTKLNVVAAFDAVGATIDTSGFEAVRARSHGILADLMMELEDGDGDAAFMWGEPILAPAFEMPAGGCSMCGHSMQMQGDDPDPVERDVVYRRTLLVATISGDEHTSELAPPCSDTNERLAGAKRHTSVAESSSSKRTKGMGATRKADATAAEDAARDLYESEKRAVLLRHHAEIERQREELRQLRLKHDELIERAREVDTKE